MIQTLKTTATVFSAALVLLIAAPVAEAGIPVRTLKGKVAKVVDGDTIHFQPHNARASGKPLTIRMVTMDTGETKLPAPGGVYSQGFWAERGMQELQSILKVGDVVEVDDYGHDTYGRVLGRVYRGQMDVNFEMVASGWAALYVICDGETDCTTDVAYRKACRSAVSNGRGLFDPARPIPELPFLFRSRVQKRPLSKLVGDFRTKKYVSPERWKEVPICERVFFMSKAAAVAEGYTAKKTK